MLGRQASPENARGTPVLLRRKCLNRAGFLLISGLVRCCMSARYGSPSLPEFSVECWALLSRPPAERPLGVFFIPGDAGMDPQSLHCKSRGANFGSTFPL